MSLAGRLPKRQRGLFLARARRLEQPCEHGHLGCSDRPDGPCSAELLMLIEGEHATAKGGLGKCDCSVCYHFD